MKIIKEVIERAVKKLGSAGGDFSVEHPRDERHGDYSTNVAMILWGDLNQPTSSDHSPKVAQGSKLAGVKSPRELASKIVTQLHSDTVTQIWDKVEVAGSGFINFFLKKEFFLEEMKKASEDGYGKNEAGKGKLAIVEYSSPNIAKPFTIGHLRSTVIGDAVANLLEFTGWRVLRDNHLGDWGTQFGKQICAIKHWGDLAKIEKSENPVKELVTLYVKFHEEAEKDPTLEDEARAWFKKLEEGDVEARELWQRCIDWSWVEFRRIYEMLGIKHSEEFNGGRGLGESFFEDKMGEIVEILNTKGMLKEGEKGAKLVFFPDEKYSPAMILKKDGATLYHTRDLATDKYRRDKYKPDLIVNEVGAEQQLYFQQLYEMERMLGWYKEGQRVHVMHGMYRFAAGKMSTRKGNVIWLEEVLEEAVKRASILQKAERKWDDTGVTSKSTKLTVGAKKHLVGVAKGWDLAEQVGIGALKWNDLKGEAKRDIVFDWNEVLNMKGNSGPYLQYTYARARSVLRKATTTRVEPSQLDQIQGFNPSMEELSILRWLYRYPEVVAEAGEKFAPHMVAGYIYELATRFNTFYNQHQIVGNQARVELTRAVANVLKSGLEVLGIQAPKEM